MKDPNAPEVLAWLETVALKSELAPYLKRSRQSDGWYVSSDDQAFGPVQVPVEYNDPLEAFGDRRLEAGLEERHHLVAPVRPPGHRAAGESAQTLDHRRDPKRPRGERVGGQLLLARDSPGDAQEHPAIPEKR